VSESNDASGAIDRRLWMAAGVFSLAFVVLVFLGDVFSSSVMLGDKPSAVAAGLVHSSMAKNFAGGYISLLSFLVFLAGATLFARLLRGEGETGGWLSSCMTATAAVYVAVTIATGFAAGAAAVYNGHHGASLATVTTVDDIRNLGFILSGAVSGMFAILVAAAARHSARLPGWVTYSGWAVGILAIAAVPAGRTGLDNVTTMLWFVWLVALGVAALVRARRGGLRPGPERMTSATVTRV
jgi:uncharacterized membrane protein YhaH (DUF805 family)